MILALQTGWTPAVIGELGAFRRACHWALYGRAIAGEEGIPSGDVPQGAPAEVVRDALRVRAAVVAQREALFPADGVGEEG